MKKKRNKDTGLIPKPKEKRKTTKKKDFRPSCALQAKGVLSPDKSPMKKEVIDELKSNMPLITKLY